MKRSASLVALDQLKGRLFYTSAAISEKNQCVALARGSRATSGRRLWPCRPNVAFFRSVSPAPTANTRLSRLLEIIKCVRAPENAE